MERCIIKMEQQINVLPIVNNVPYVVYVCYLMDLRKMLSKIVSPEGCSVFSYVLT